jgi:hypothetical protein
MRKNKWGQPAPPYFLDLYWRVEWIIKWLFLYWRHPKKGWWVGTHTCSNKLADWMYKNDPKWKIFIDKCIDEAIRVENENKI